MVQIALRFAKSEVEKYITPGKQDEELLHLADRRIQSALEHASGDLLAEAEKLKKSIDGCKRVSDSGPSKMISSIAKRFKKYF